jgi:hypothetical protein
VCTANWCSFPAIFICKLFLLILYMWYFSNVFKCFPVFYVLIISTVSVMVPYILCLMCGLSIPNYEYYYYF